MLSSCTVHGTGSIWEQGFMVSSSSPHAALECLSVVVVVEWNILWLIERGMNYVHRRVPFNSIPFLPAPPPKTTSRWCLSHLVVLSACLSIRRRRRWGGKDIGVSGRFARINFTNTKCKLIILPLPDYCVYNIICRYNILDGYYHNIKEWVGVADAGELVGWLFSQVT